MLSVVPWKRTTPKSDEATVTKIHSSVHYHRKLSHRTSLIYLSPISDELQQTIQF